MAKVFLSDKGMCRLSNYQTMILSNLLRLGISFVLIQTLVVQTTGLRLSKSAVNQTVGDPYAAAGIAKQSQGNEQTGLLCGKMAL